MVRVGGRRLAGVGQQGVDLPQSPTVLRADGEDRLFEWERGSRGRVAWRAGVVEQGLLLVEAREPLVGRLARDLEVACGLGDAVIPAVRTA